MSTLDRASVSPTERLAAVGRWLLAQGYRFTTVAPATHARVNARPGNRQAQDLRGVFGWSRPFARGLLDRDVLDWLQEAGLVRAERADGGLLRSQVRYSTLRDQLYVHSAYPTVSEDAVFFGPDTYRFVQLLESELLRSPLRSGARILDIGCGAGPGGIAATLASRAASPALVLADINPMALVHARANAALAGVSRVAYAQGDLFSPVEGAFDLIVANPPYLVDAAARIYRHGGGALGAGLSERIVTEGLPRLSPGGRLVLYTGVAIVDGVDPLLEVLQPLLRANGWQFSYRELDPDVFGEELDTPAYAGADRIAVVALVVRRPDR